MHSEIKLIMRLKAFLIGWYYMILPYFDIYLL